MAFQIYNHPEIKKFNKLCVGQYGSHFNNVENTTVMGLIPNTKVLELLSDTKILIIPSVFEASPNICTEAISSKCYVLSTLNVGNFEYVDEFFTINNRSDINEWVNKIVEILQSKSPIPPVLKYKNNIDNDLASLINSSY